MIRLALTTALLLGAASTASAQSVDAYPEGTYQKIKAAFLEGDVDNNVDMFSAQDVAKIFAVYANDFEDLPEDDAAAVVVADVIK